MVLKTVKNILKKIVPKFIFRIYYWLLAKGAAFFYGFPSKKMIVIGVTGTAGKSTTVNFIAKFLQSAGYTVGLASTFNFKIGNHEWLNKTKMTMLGRFALQKLLKKMVKAGCQYAVIETSSEGIAQYRHLGIHYDVAVFTNLYPEHLEAHGSLSKYRQAKEKLFAHLSRLPHKKIKNRKIYKVSIFNLDDQAYPYFLRYHVDNYFGYRLKKNNLKSSGPGPKNLEVMTGENLILMPESSEFVIKGKKFILNLPGEFNVYNILAALAVAKSQDISLEQSAEEVEKIKTLPGRLEEIKQGQDFRVFVDYAHTPESLEKVYLAVEPLKKGKLIAVLGSCGGGRDKWKRPEMGRIAGQYADYVFVTNEDPYDEDPQAIINAVYNGIVSEKAVKSMFLDRAEAIQNALQTAKTGDLVIITGKGAEQCIMGTKGLRIPWDDREIVRKILNELHFVVPI